MKSDSARDRGFCGRWAHLSDELDQFLIDVVRYHLNFDLRIRVEDWEAGPSESLRKWCWALRCGFLGVFDVRNCESSDLRWCVLM